ncbi:GNAT family N-acetyltransferase [Pseudophaeobacter sp.]|uniref:GNAT family N-acetyltransferase n=1 Tax=Pseudophaeobacter sp. TaxID=1971739 RepID=UPI003299CA78
MRLEILAGAALDRVLPALAGLRIEVFRDWPYLYDGDLEYETAYLQSYRNSKEAIVVGAFDGGTLIGASTGTPLTDHAEDFAAAFEGRDIDLNCVFYCAESVLLPAYRGLGLGHEFFDARESHAQAWGYSKSAFCSVRRPVDHPMRAKDYNPLDPFWRKRGYLPMEGVVAQFCWKDLDSSTATDKPLQFWVRDLTATP